MSGQDTLRSYLPGEADGDLRRDGRPDADTDLIAAELGYIAGTKGESAKHIASLRDTLKNGGPADETAYLFGLALSGGGIRSATFSLGVLQRLAKARILEHVDYLSTVSGGGYIGSALSWWMSGQSGSKQAFDLGANFPYGTSDPKDAEHDHNPLLGYLRRNGRYLIPGHGITIWSAVSVILRAVLLNLLVWVPIVAFLFLLLRWLGTLPFLNGLPSMVGMLVPDALPALVGLVGSASTVHAGEVVPPVFLLCILLAVLLAALFLISAINYSLLSWMGRGEAALRNSTVEPDIAAGRRARTSPLRLAGRWLLVGLLGVLDLAVFFVLFQWLLALMPPMFGAGMSATPLAGELLGKWPWALAILAVVGGLILHVARRDSWTKSDWTGFAKVFIGFGVLFALDGVLALALFLGAPPAILWGAVNLGWVAGLIQIVAAVGLLVFLNFWVAYLIRWLLRTEGLSGRYGGRRIFEQIFGYAFLGIVGLLALGAVPVIVSWIGVRFAGLEGALSVAAGVASAFWGHLKARAKSADGRGTTLVLVAGSILFLYGLALVGYRIALGFETGDALLRAGLTCLLAIAVLTGWFSNINYIALHRFYRDRLMEAFLPDHETVVERVVGPARRADELRISDLWRNSDARGPFHIVNTNLVLVNSGVRKYRMRGGDNFILSQLYSGSAATGWQRSATHMNGEMTLASAMATSGAAANPRSGPGGRGATRNRFVSLVMTLLNFRLGYWIPRPGDRKILFKRPNHFRPSGLYSIFDSGYRENNTLLELSDGGHFENLAIYELVRRRCGLIILCDGGQDIEASYADFVTAIHRIGQDFGATVHFDMEIDDTGAGGFKDSGPDALIARNNRGIYPKHAEYADKGYFLATIDYGHRGGGPWPRKGTIIYLKTTMIEDLSMTAKGYKGANPDFPDQTTADQFFDEEQFEAYRELGYRISEQMIGDLGLEGLFQTRAPHASLRGNMKFRERP